MNEKLKQEVRKFCNENVTGYNPIYTGNSLTYSMLPKCAEHFYNLALEEVRTLILKRLEMHDKDREDFAWMWAEDKRILKEIDNLTK